MNGATFFSGRYGSTAQYAEWIGEATGLPVFDIKDRDADPSRYDFLVLGSSVILYKLSIRQWVKKHLPQIEPKPAVLFTVSGAPAGAKLDGWIANSLPAEVVAGIDHVALPGRLDLKDVSWWTRLLLRIGAWKNDDPKAKKEELEGFDFMDQSTIEPVAELIRRLEARAGVRSQEVVPSAALTRPGGVDDLER